MTKGGCLCGGVRFEIEQIEGPFELCHCSRCRRTTGSAFAAGIWVRGEHFRLIRGADLVRTYEAPVLRSPPPYRTAFCSTCGSPVPLPDPGFPFVEVPAGTLDDDPGLRPDRHMLFGPKAAWFEITDDLPQMSPEQIAEDRSSRGFF
jgi:hypothetical protein